MSAARARATVPGQVAAPQGGARAGRSEQPAGFGAEDVRTPERFRGARRPAAGNRRADHARSARASRASTPFTLEDGAQWLFAEGVSSSYRVPRAGSVVEIERGALGSFLMRFDDQAPVPVRRVR